MHNLIYIDYSTLDNGAFLRALAKTIAYNNTPDCLFIHRDSAYTERIIQLGIIREDAEIRAIKELNHRLAALFADEGIPIIALNGHQRKLIIIDDNGQIIIDSEYLKSISGKTHLLVSCLGFNSESKIQPLDAYEVIKALNSELNISNIYFFSEKSDENISSGNNHIDSSMATELAPIKDKIKWLGPEFLINGRLI